LAVLACAAFASGGVAAQTDTYPSRPIRYIVASAPGGIADLTARVLGPRLFEALRQPVVIENRTTGGILVGGELVAKAPADGYTLLSATPQVAIAQSMYKNTTFNPRPDLAPVALVGIIPNVLLVNPKTSATTVQELVELARRNPGKLNYSSNIVQVPYRGSAAATAALIAGDVDMLVDCLPPSLRHIRAGKARALAVTTAARVPQLPEVPTMIESGFPGFEMLGWSGVVTTAGTPAAVIAILETEIRRALEHAQTAAAYEKAGLPLHFLGAKDFGAFWDAEIEKFAIAVRHSGAKVE
jgi:tripartite-type tricarboxylate transporter receptor subunit TctC